MDRGVRASIEGLTVVKAALKLNGWTQDYLAGSAGCSRQTLARFFAGKPVEKRIFTAICTELKQKWIDIAEREESDKPNDLPSVDELVENVRISVYDSIQTKCGSMRVLDMTQPIDLNSIYTNVNILEKITGRQRLELQELIQRCSSEDFERFSLSGVQEARIPALEAVDKYPKLMILGKPGAGKTTFLKYVALTCIEGIFKPNLIPLFVTLKDFAEAENRPNLLDYLIQLFRSYGIEPGTKVKKGLFNALFDGGSTPIEFLLRQGRFAILLDGLDEVREADSSRVLQQIQDFSNRFAKNLFAITCRIAAREYTFEKFVEVEVADFDDSQIATFTKQWFQTKNDPIKAENFIEKLQSEPGIRELATSPLLLTLLCLVFGESGSFPVNRSELYKEGLDVLLKKWDAKRNIERDWVYQNLSLKRKEDLLSQIAFDTFEKGNYFFKQKEAEWYINQYIRNLSSTSSGEDKLQLDSEAVLKSIEAQHGIFVERARGIYSFSHLTFHEYFTARKIVTSNKSDFLVQKLATQIAEKKWREVLLLTVGMLDNADFLLEAMKQKIDSILGQDEKLQQFLIWVDQKSRSTNTSYKPNTVRSYYLAIDLDLDLDLDLNPDLDLDLDLTLARALTRALDLDLALALALTRALDLALKSDSLNLQQSLEQMKNKLPENRDNFYQWWTNNGQAWAEQLRSIAIKHRNIGHDWQFTEEQKKLLQQYYDANKLLVDCLNSDCYVSREVRESIESTLFLPIASIEKLKLR